MATPREVEGSPSSHIFAAIFTGRRGGATLAPEITAVVPPITPPVREMPLPKDPTQPDKPLTPPKRRYLKGKNLALAVVAGSALGVGVGPKPANVNEYLSEHVASIPGKLWNKMLAATDGLSELGSKFIWGSGKVEGSSTFDPKATQGVIGRNNMVSITSQEYAQIAPSEVEANKVTIPWFLKSPEGAQPIKYKLTKPFQDIKRTVTPENGEKEEVSVYDSAEFKNVALGTELISRWDGEISQYRSRVNADGVQKDFVAQITTKDAQGNPYTINLSTTKIKLAMDIPYDEDVTIPGPPVQYKLVRHPVPIKKGEIIGTIAGTDPVHGTVDAQVYVGVKDSKGVTNLGFAVSPDGKLIDIR